MGEAKRKNDRLHREAQEYLQEAIARGERTLLIEGDKMFAVGADGGESEIDQKIWARKKQA